MLPPTTTEVVAAMATKTGVEKTARDIERCRAEGRSLEEFWKAFNAPREDQAWWYDSLLDHLSAKVWPAEARPLLQRFEHAVAVIKSA